MDFLLIGGQPNTGKSETIARIYVSLASRYTLITNIHPTNPLPPIPLTLPVNDFSVILEGIDTSGKEVKILLHSFTDSPICINLLKQFIKTNTPDIIITSIRDLNPDRKGVLDIIGSHYFFEIPLAKITWKNRHKKLTSLHWYKMTIDNVVKLAISNPPYNLI